MGELHRLCGAWSLPAPHTGAGPSTLANYTVPHNPARRVPIWRGTWLYPRIMSAQARGAPSASSAITSVRMRLLRLRRPRARWPLEPVPGARRSLRCGW
jgi:hypothetical protein